MENAETYLRRMAGKSKEMKVSTINVTGTAVKFTSALTGGFGRTGLYVWNKSHTSSGEIYFGPLGVTPATGFPVAKRTFRQLFMTEDIDIYFITETGENGDLRVLELS